MLLCLVVRWLDSCCLVGVGLRLMFDTLEFTVLDVIVLLIVLIHSVSLMCVLLVVLFMFDVLWRFWGWAFVFI